VRMTPSHVKRKLWWELIFIGVLVFLLVGARTQRTQDVAVAARARPPAPSIKAAAIVTALAAPLTLKKN